MSLPSVSIQPFDGPSVCLFCASSDGSDPAYLQSARDFGAATAASGWRLVYGGGGVGLMGAAADHGPRAREEKHSTRIISPGMRDKKGLPLIMAPLRPKHGE